MKRPAHALFTLPLFALLLLPAARATEIPKPPAVDARAYLLEDFASGQVLAQEKADERMEPASLTKIMTAYVVFKALREKRLKLDELVTISEHAWRAGGAGSGGSTTFLKLGSQVPVEVLIKGMIIQSGNDASIALAERVGGTEGAFVELMNASARDLGMKSTHFEDSTGLPSADHTTTARDMATLSRALIRDFPDYYRYYGMHDFVWNNIHQQNRNGLLDRDPTVDGIKTGHTDAAGYCLITSANRNGMRLISVVLGSPSVKAREDASAALINYGYTFYETSRLKSRGETLLNPRVYKGAADNVAVGPMTDVSLTLPRGDAGAIRTSVHVEEPLIAPLARGKAVGELDVSDASGDVVQRVPLYPLADVAAGGIWSRLKGTVALWLR
jgi:D-alanyl-D-alanine carboxypeptidase (penicillin-binding protein 5/6)